MSINQFPEASIVNKEFSYREEEFNWWDCVIKSQSNEIGGA